jgi:hypothetical protein
LACNHASATSRLLLRRQQCIRRGAAGAPHAPCTRAPGLARARLGAGRHGPFVQRGGAGAAAASLAPGGAPLSRWPHRAVVGYRAHAARYGPGKPVRAVCATTNRRELPTLSTWYLTTNLPSPLGESVRLYGLRNWTRQGYKQMNDELGWADFMVRSDRTFRLHWALVCCAFSFCWWHDALQAHTGDLQLADMSEAPPEAGKKLAASRRCHAGPASRTRRLDCRPRH